MTAITRTTVFTTLFATIVTALVLTANPGHAQADGQAAAPTQRNTPMVVVHQLPRVVVTGRVQRSETQGIVELPRVVVTGRRVDASQTLVSQAAGRAATPRS